MPSPRLLPLEALVKTNPVDHADWNYQPLIGIIQRWRFRLISDLLAGERCDRMLEIGYGSGVFMPELARYSATLYGIDPHPYFQQVTESLAKHGVAAELHSPTAESLPFPDACFDCIVSVSALEYITDIDVACREMTRVLRPGGRLVCVTPGSSALVDCGLRVLTGEEALQYGDRRERLIPALHRHFANERQLSLPPLGGKILRLYNAFRMRRR